MRLRLTAVALTCLAAALTVAGCDSESNSASQSVAVTYGTQLQDAGWKPAPTANDPGKEVLLPLTAALSDVKYGISYDDADDQTRDAYAAGVIRHRLSLVPALDATHLRAWTNPDIPNTLVFTLFGSKTTDHPERDNQFAMMKVIIDGPPKANLAAFVASDAQPTQLADLANRIRQLTKPAIGQVIELGSAAGQPAVNGLFGYYGLG